MRRAKAGDDASCDFIRHAGSQTFELRIETETMPSPDFQSFAARCHPPVERLKAIGNEALACGDESGGRHAEQVVGRVRDRAFLVRISTAGQPAALREKARKIAEQVAGILF